MQCNKMNKNIKHNKTTLMLNIFNIKLKKYDISKTKGTADYQNNKNFVSKPKHYPPANKE